LKSDQKKQLRARAHALKPVVITGQAGLSPAVLSEIDVALEHHELIKVRVNADDREMRKEMAQHICSELGADLVQSIGHIVTLYRKRPEQKS
jgi:RNA-binding protein